MRSTKLVFVALLLLVSSAAAPDDTRAAQLLLRELAGENLTPEESALLKRDLTLAPDAAVAVNKVSNSPTSLGVPVSSPVNAL